MDSVRQAFKKIDRRDFLPEEYKDQAHVDSPLPIGFGQTNSQPTTVRLMLEWLEVEPGNKILDLGSGSGWTTALLAYLAGYNGQVYAVEKIPELLEMGRNNCRRAGIKNVHFYHAGGQYGLPEQAPYDRILVSAAALELPKALLSQLKVGGKLVVPVRHDVLEITKNTNSDYNEQVHPGFAFVPLVKPT